MSTAADEYTTLAEKIETLALDPSERRSLEQLFALASMREVVDIELVASPSLLRAPVQRAIVRKVALTLDITVERATAALRDALTYLDSATRNFPVSLAPSPIVDEAWHQFILFTVDYAAYCDAVAGRFIHHHPIIPGISLRSDCLSVAESYAYLRAQGYELDESLWRDEESGVPSSPDQQHHNNKERQP